MGGSAPADIVNQRRIDQLTEEHLAKSALDNESPIQGGLNGSTAGRLQGERQRLGKGR
jgi:hypothetical protein